MHAAIENNILKKFVKLHSTIFGPGACFICMNGSNMYCTFVQYISPCVSKKIVTTHYMMISSHIWCLLALSNSFQLMCADNYLQFLFFNFIVKSSLPFCSSIHYMFILFLFLFIFYFDNSIYRLDLPQQAAIH